MRNIILKLLIVTSIIVQTTTAFYCNRHRYHHWTFDPTQSSNHVSKGSHDKSIMILMMTDLGQDALGNNIQKLSLKSQNGVNRGDFIAQQTVSILSYSLLLSTYYPPESANASFFSKNDDRRQLELCLVTILRVKYWSQSVSNDILRMIENKSSNGMILTDNMKAPYLEARLGAKALLTGKVGGGANLKVYSLSSFQLKGCIKDALSWFDDEFYYNYLKDKSLSKETKSMIKKRRYDLQTVSDEIIESLASVVEFDGLETTQDPSPRSSLALSMYTDSKAKFVSRMLLERTVANCDAFIDSFGQSRRQFCEEYARKNFPNEQPLPNPTPTPISNE